MENVLEQIETKTVNFLDFTQKDTDWRYKTHKEISRQVMLRERDNRSESKTIYWIGIIDLSKITEDSRSTSLSFLNRYGRIVTDTYVGRHEDGAEDNTYPEFQYSLKDPAFKKKIMEAREQGYDYFHVLLEEECEGYGQSDVHLFFCPNAEDGLTHGWPTKGSTFLHASFSVVRDFGAFTIHKEIEKLCIRHEGNYRWMK